MKQRASEKYTVAWFKLADCIARGEKERALGVYRLLSHSLDNPALACQLHADILLSFEDTAAIDKYRQAAQMHIDAGEVLQAAAIYEHLRDLQPESSEYRLKLIELYQQLSILSKLTEYVIEFVSFLLARDEWQRAIEIVGRFDTAADESFAAGLHEQILFYLLAKKDVLPDTIMAHARAAIDYWQQQGNERAIGQLLERMAALNEKMAGYCREYWQAQ